MKIKVYDPKDHEYHEIADVRDFRITLDNGDAYDLSETRHLSIEIKQLKVKAVNPESRLVYQSVPTMQSIFIETDIDK